MGLSQDSVQQIHQDDVLLRRTLLHPETAVDHAAPQIPRSSHQAQEQLLHRPRLRGDDTTRTITSPYFKTSYMKCITVKNYTEAVPLQVLYIYIERDVYKWKRFTKKEGK